MTESIHQPMDADLADLVSHLDDREWRLNNLYFVKDESGTKVQFVLNEVQKELHDSLWFFNIVPKARQVGVTTFFSILYLDQILFSENKTAGIIAHRQEDMKKIFKNKVKFAWDNLHPWLKAKIGEPDTNSANELIFPNGSSIFVSMTTRSGTVQFLHISEFGYICNKYPEKAEEIVTGAINSVHAGCMVSIESTAAGREGYFYDFTMKADRMKKEGRELTPLDFKLFFFPWWIDKRYILDGSFAFTEEYKKYFKHLEDKYKINLTDAQKRWYIKKKEINGEKMSAEYPSTLEEAFSVSIEGAYYAKEMDRVYQNQRIMMLPYDSKYPVDTYWDLGMNDMMVIVFAQQVGPQIRVIDLYYNHGEKLAHYVDVMKAKGYRYRKHILPHDVEVKDMSSGLSRKQTLYDLGLWNIIVAPKLGIQDGIELVRGIFSKLYFDEEKTLRLYEALGNYRKDWDPKLGTFKDSPRHDDNSHFADAMRYLAATYSEEPVEDLWAGESREAPSASFFS